MLVFHRFLWIYTSNPSTRGLLLQLLRNTQAGLQIRNAVQQVHYCNRVHNKVLCFSETECPHTKCVFPEPGIRLSLNLLGKKTLWEKLLVKGLFRRFLTCLKWRNRPAPTGNSPISYLPMLHIKLTWVSVSVTYVWIFHPFPTYYATYIDWTCASLWTLHEAFIRLCGTLLNPDIFPTYP
jgi:hypothetical protein